MTLLGLAATTAATTTAATTTAATTTVATTTAATTIIVWVLSPICIYVPTGHIKGGNVICFRGNSEPINCPRYRIIRNHLTITNIN
jgi:hypothetical protein